MSLNTKRFVFAGLVLALLCAGAAIWSIREPPAPDRTRSARASAPKIEIDANQIADAGFLLVDEYLQVGDSSSLGDLKAGVEERGPRALEATQNQLAELERSPAPPLGRLAHLHYKIGSIQTYLGQYSRALASLEEARRLANSAGAPPRAVAHMTACMGLVALRRGEVENCIQCVGPSSCIFPIAAKAVHTNPAGSRQAIEFFQQYLRQMPGDLRIIWPLNLAYMALGEYPDQVPPNELLPLDKWQSPVDVGHFENVASLVGLTARGPNQAGGSAFDDFTGDASPDLFTTSLDADRGASLYVNRGDGTFAEGSDAAGLEEQVYALNLAHADFDNDGQLDLLLLRGGWEMPMRLSLLHNCGDGTFQDVTIAAGLGDPICTESAAWGDYDNDGLVDLFVCGEYVSAGGRPYGPDPLNVCRLYHNEGAGRFVNVAAAAGVDIQQCSKGSAWGDFDGDGWLDLFVSNMNTRAMLYRNQRDGTFREVALEQGVRGPPHGFGCWFWDYDNDGRLDLYVNDYTASLAEFVAQFFNMPPLEPSSPRLYHNGADSRFQDVTAEAGLERIALAMGCNFGDIDNDGFLDIYLGCGRMALEGLMPNLMFWNDAGRRFADVTASSGTGHLQKGHGVSFADCDGDGDLDLFVEEGGGVPGDRAYNALFRNPGHGRHWLKVKLIGVRSNRAALGARIEAVVAAEGGASRSIYRTVGNNGSFGGNSLVQSIGLAEATKVEKLVVSWPSSGTTQTFQDVGVDQEIEITEETAAIQTVRRPPPAADPVGLAD